MQNNIIIFYLFVYLSNKIINMIDYIRFFLKKLKTIKYEKVQKDNYHVKIII